MLGIPPALYDLLDFIDANFGRTDGRVLPVMLTAEDFKRFTVRAGLAEWTLILPCRRFPNDRIEIPLPAYIDKKDPEGHWRAILAAAADFQSLVESGGYKRG